MLSENWVESCSHRYWIIGRDPEATNYQLHSKYSINIFWLVVSTPLKNISQLGSLFPIDGKIKNVPNHQPDIAMLKNHFIPHFMDHFPGFYPWCPVQASCWSPHHLRRRPPSPWAGNGSLATKPSRSTEGTLGVGKSMRKSMEHPFY